MFDPIQQFRAALADRGIVPPSDIVADGKIHRCDAEGKEGKGDAAYLLHMDGIPAGGFENHRDGLKWENWRADIGRTLTPSEVQENNKRIEAVRQQRKAEDSQRKEKSANAATAKWKAAKPASSEHPYLLRKGIKQLGLREEGGALLIPMREGEKLHSLQYIHADGQKRFLAGGRVAGCYFSIGNPDGAEELCICEGFATGASIHEATGYPVAVAFNAGNLLAVAKAMRERFPDMTLILCADDDYRTEGNPGITKATEAAQAVDGKLAVPNFGNNRPKDATDFNDMAAAFGSEAVQKTIINAVSPSNGGAGNTPRYRAWPEPQLLAIKVGPEPYPLDALPNTTRAAVEEVQGFTKAPVPLVASSALAALSLAIQPHADAKRAEKLTGPASLFLLTIADSGERKSTCDGFFTKAIRDYEETQAELAKPMLKDHRAAIEAWEAKRGGVKEQIRQLAKSSKPTANLEAALRELEHEKPEPPRVPRQLYADATPEALAYGLAKNWPSGGVVSAEAGIVFGAHGMGKDSVMRNLALLNVLWDGGNLTIDRRTTESFTVRGARLTVALQVQEATLRSFFDRSGGLARGTGFLARFLIAWPESTQGFRPFTEAPEHWPALVAFNRRLADILEQPAPIDENGALTPPLLPLTTEAKVAWVAFHDAIESELRSGRELYDVRDVASKTADNAVRLAALFQVFDGASSAIGVEAFESASRIVAWHLNEARRFFGELALPEELADAVRLDGWLIEYCRMQRTSIVPRRDVQRNVMPSHLRQRTALDAALGELAEAGRIRLVQDGKRKEIHINPALLERGGK